MSTKKSYVSNRISLLLLIVLFLLAALDFCTGLFLKNLTNLEKIAIYVVIFIIPIIVYIKKSRSKAKYLLNLNYVKIKYLPFIILFGTSASIICALINMGVFALAKNAVDFNITTSTVNFTSDKTYVVVLTSVILPAICEELLLRGVALSEYARYGVSISVIMTSVIFALFHSNALTIPSLFVAGVFYAVLTHLFKSVWPAIICHTINNALALYVSANSDYISYLLTDIIFVVALVCILFIIMFVTLKLTEGIIDDLGSKNRLKTNVKKLAYGDPLGSLYIWLFFALSIFLCIRKFL